MSVLRTAGITGLALALAACSTIETAKRRIVRAPACADQTVQIYFESDSAELTRDGRAVIRAAADAARSCQVTAVEVVGLADAAGTADANLELSKRRAQSVTAALASAGLPNAEFKVAAAGQAGSVTADGKTAPLRRRADVTLRVAERK